MITRGAVTIYHLIGQDAVTRLEKYVRYNYPNVWYHDSQVAQLNQGINDANKIRIRIPYKQNDNLDINNFAKGDIIVKGALDLDIDTQQDLDGYETYTITSYNDDNYGSEPHIYIGGI